MNMMAESVAPVELVVGEKYYISGAGIFTYKGPVSRNSGIDLSTVSKQYRTSDTQLHKFEPDQVYSLHKKPIPIPEPEIKQGKRVHAIPDIKDLAKDLRIVTQGVEPAEPNDQYKMMTTNVTGLAQLIRDHKKHRDAILERSRETLSMVLSYRLEVLPKEADEYLTIMANTSQWPINLPEMPVSHKAMTAIIDRRKAKLPFDEDFILSLGGTRTSPAPQHNAPQSVASAVSVHLPGKAKFIQYRGNDLKSSFGMSHSVYTSLYNELRGTTMIKIVDAAAGAITVGEAVDLSRLIFAEGALNIGNMTMAKNKELSSGTPHWTSETVRNHFHALLEKVSALVPSHEQHLVREAVDSLHRKIGTVRKTLLVKPPEHVAPVVTSSVPPVQSPVVMMPVATPIAAAPAPVTVTPAPSEPPQPEVIAAPVQATQSPVVQECSSASAISAPIAEKTPHDKGFVSDDFKIAVRRHPDDQDSNANDHQLELVVRHEDELPVALVAAKALTPMAFDIFSRKFLRGQSVEQIVERVGTNAATVSKVFEEAVQVVEERLQGHVTSLRTAVAEISHKSEPS